MNTQDIQEIRKLIKKKVGAESEREAAFEKLEKRVDELEETTEQLNLISGSDSIKRLLDEIAKIYCRAARPDQAPDKALKRIEKLCEITLREFGAMT